MDASSSTNCKHCGATGHTADEARRASAELEALRERIERRRVAWHDRFMSHPDATTRAAVVMDEAATDFGDLLEETATTDVAGDTPEPSEALIHYSFVTPERRPFLSRMLCDLAGFGTYPQVASSNWARVTCPQCQDIGADTVIALHCMSSDALVSLGAVATQDEATR